MSVKRYAKVNFKNSSKLDIGGGQSKSFPMGHSLIELDLYEAYKTSGMFTLINFVESEDGRREIPKAESDTKVKKKVLNETIHAG